MVRKEIKDHCGFIKGYTEKVGDTTNVYDGYGSLVGYSNSSGTFTANGVKKYSSGSATMLLDR